jgi:hypothetical protein
VPPQAQSGVVAIAAGSSHSDDYCGQLDAPADGVVGVTAIAASASSYFTLVLK